MVATWETFKAVSGSVAKPVSGPKVTVSSFITMHYSITGDATASGTISYAFQSFSSPNDRWGTDINGSNASDISVDLISTHSLANGDYNIAVWVEGKPNNIGSVFDNNGGSNYNATFTVVPEPASALLGVLGTALLLRRRRI